MTSRINWIDALKGFAIFIVVIGHCSADCLASNTFPGYTNIIKIVNDFIYSFHMPLFFTISGFVFYLSKSYQKYKLKVLDFTIIYFIWSFFMWLSKFLMGNKINNPVTIDDLFKIVYQPIMVYWYLYVLIVFYLIFSISNITTISKKQVVICFMVAIITKNLGLEIGILNAILYHMYFWVLGGYMACSDLLRKLDAKILGLCLLVCITNIISSVVVSNLGIFVILLKNILLATAATVLLFSCFNKGFYIGKDLLIIFGLNALPIYVVHCFITAGLRVMFKVLHINNVYLYFVLGTLLGLCIPILLIKWCSKNAALSLPFTPINTLKSLGVIKP